MEDNFDDKSNNNTGTAYPTRDEIENIVNSALDKKGEKNT
jgi:hypothetical protein